MVELGDSIKTADYADLLKNIKERITEAQYAALKSVNTELITLYWDIGQMILQKQRGRTWGQEVVQRVSKDLQSAFPGIKGFSASNLWRMKLFHETYARNKVVVSASAVSICLANVIADQSHVVRTGCKTEAGHFKGKGH